MHDIFEADRIFDDCDQELDLIASRARRAQWRHRNVGPTYLKMGRRVKYFGADLNAWIPETLNPPLVRSLKERIQ